MRVLLPVEKQFGTVAQITGIGVALVPHGTPFEPVAPKVGMSHSLHEGEIRFEALAAAHRKTEVVALHLGRDAVGEPDQTEQRGRDVGRIEADIRPSPLRPGATDEKGNAARLVVEDHLEHAALRGHHLAVIRRKDDNRVVGDAQTVEQLHHATELLVDGVHHRIIAAHGLLIPLPFDEIVAPAGPAVEILGEKAVHIGIGILVEILRKLEFHVFESLVTMRRNVPADPGVVRGAPGEHQREGLFVAGMFTNVVEREPREDLRTVLPFEIDMHGLAVGTVRIVKCAVIDVVERIGRPIAVESHALGPRLVGTAVGIVPMDFAHVAGLVAGIREHMGQGPVVGIQVQFVDHHARR